MNSKFQVLARWLLFAGLSVIFSSMPAVLSAAEFGLAGLWEARRILGPADSGSLLIRRSGNRVLAEDAPGIFINHHLPFR